MSDQIIRVERLESRRLLSDISLAFIDKSESFEQTDASTVIPEPAENGSPFGFVAEVIVGSGGSVSSASVTTPALAVDPLTSNGNSLRIKEGFTRLSDLDQTFGEGNYSLKVNAATDGTHTFSLAMNDGDTYPNAPLINDFDSLQEMDPAHPQTIGWNNFSGGMTSDLIIVQISDPNNNTVFNTGEQAGDPSTLNGTATSVNVPAGTLSPGVIYTVNVNFVHPLAVDLTHYPGVDAFAVHSSDTSFNFSTMGASDNNGALVVNGGTGNDTIGVTASNGNYVVRTDDVAPQSFPTGSVSSIEIFGGAGSDSIGVDASVTQAVTLHGAGGDDTLDGGSGADLIRGGTGNDVESGGAGRDTCIGGAGNDSIMGGTGGDQLQGGADNDTLIGGGGDDTLFAGLGFNNLSGGGGNDSLYAVNGNADTVNGGTGVNTGQFDAGIDSVLNIQG